VRTARDFRDKEWHQLLPLLVRVVHLFFFALYLFFIPLQKWNSQLFVINGFITDVKSYFDGRLFAWNHNEVCPRCIKVFCTISLVILSNNWPSFPRCSEFRKRLFWFWAALTHNFSCGLGIKLRLIDLPQFQSWISGSWPTETIGFIGSSTLRLGGLSRKSTVVFFYKIPQKVIWRVSPYIFYDNVTISRYSYH
jgi:hypothetical protein